MDGKCFTMGTMQRVRVASGAAKTGAGLFSVPSSGGSGRLTLQLTPDECERRLFARFERNASEFIARRYGATEADIIRHALYPDRSGRQTEVGWAVLERGHDLALAVWETVWRPQIIPADVESMLRHRDDLGAREAGLYVPADAEPTFWAQELMDHHGIALEYSPVLRGLTGVTRVRRTSHHA